ncbi:MAG: bifunctional diaminohydroxyphosphoribosylaminopyrimidine deaminase/5-amino-6-(5-phosphoribosylamino)uracil reductase RibD [Gammaproteobacteria bacterium]|nr:bifunctional diaminohydroxyphosphoribosylaminopyrimidine deaminase/5-amino-6-(5-phosphoribosylamino)uracil reductase RibD [Gammaproteobacteria bacterium]MYH32188.1 bifunctional diaminohydroxyphosphoribosylaminopyrimidine deaminase/5-amino-6-(5-phosphoribosylamino)uracil reductase RibD [Gammaproteobacteria bacterium]
MSSQRAKPAQSADPRIDRRWMKEALELAARGLNTTDPNPRVGCVLIKDGKFVGGGWHRRAGEDHAETLALKEAGGAAKGATCYVTLEPCSHTGRTGPCADALAAAGVTRVLFAVTDPNTSVRGAGVQRLREAGVEVEGGLLEAQARELNPGYLSRWERGRPWVRVKLAASLDGRTALANRVSQWITSTEARRDGHGWRARSSAVLTGIGTLLADDPRLDARRDDLGEIKPPARIVLDSQLRTPPGARLFERPGDIHVLHCAADDEAARNRASDLSKAGASVRRLPEGSDGRVSLPAAMGLLADMEFNEIHVEAGAILCGALLAGKLIDEVVLYTAPVLLGDGAAGLFRLAPLEDMSQRPSFRVIEAGRVGPDVRLILAPVED